jgi:ribosomal protein S12 methylthiotransferase RimO
MKKVAIISLGCARNDVDSEELAAKFKSDGMQLVLDPAQADAVLVNTCGFIEQAKKDSIDTLLQAGELKNTSKVQAVVAVGCMAERYGGELADALPEADAILGFDDYDDIAAKVTRILNGEKLAPPKVQDRRLLLPVSPVDRKQPAKFRHRTRLTTGPSSPLKIAAGCDRRCTFCAIPRFRGSYISRTINEIVEEAHWLAAEGVKEIYLVSENTTSYGKDLGDLRSLEKLLAELSKIPELAWIRLSYLQPAEMRPDLTRAIFETEKVVPYFDLSFQHASASVLKRMKRFGAKDDFLAMIDEIRAKSPTAGIRSNFIVGFVQESESEFNELVEFLSAANLDSIGVFEYANEDNTAAYDFEGQISASEKRDRFNEIKNLADELIDQQANSRIGENTQVLIEGTEEGVSFGRAPHQGPDVDGATHIAKGKYNIGQLVNIVVTANTGADLTGEAVN